jgi:hypothetical protein
MKASENHDHQPPGCLGALLRLFASTRKAAPETYPYRVRDDFLSPAETSFYHVLKSMLGERLVICPKVSLAELFFVARGESYQTWQNKIDRKRVDFLLCQPQTLKPVLAIELDNSSHRRADRQERDAFVEKVFAAAGLPLARVPVRATYNTRELASLFQAAMQPAPVVSQNIASKENPARQAPTCPKCGVPMVRRTARRGNTPGQQFWGCPNYPQCQAMIAD